MIMHSYAWFGPIFSILRFWHERGQIKRWGAVRHVIVSGISMRVFFIFTFCYERTTVFRRLDVSWFPDVFWKHVLSRKMPQKCLGGVWDHPRRFRDQFWTILDQHRLKQNIRNIPIKDHITNHIKSSIVKVWLTLKCSGLLAGCPDPDPIGDQPCLGPHPI